MTVVCALRTDLEWALRIRWFVILSERSESKDLSGAIDDLRITDPR